MKNTKQSIDNLQKALSMEMTAIQQYLLHAHVLDDWGLDVLASQMRQEMTEELGHAGRFIDRILFLGGDPVVQPSKNPKRSKSLEEMFGADLDEEMSAIDFYTSSAKAADDDWDIGTRMLFEGIALDEEGHMDWLKRQLGLLARMGEPTYMAQNMSDAMVGT
ncbi:bacterioferritin [Yoonia sp.]|uniref:bacterioferritin n=1 Tax=Yoonia sp. TaxID=2212373 RepID=UPI0025F33AF5|nr:bacterioferritin [Yoonia sp.]